MTWNPQPGDALAIRADYKMDGDVDVAGPVTRYWHIDEIPSYDVAPWHSAAEIEALEDLATVCSESGYEGCRCGEPERMLECGCHPITRALERVREIREGEK